MLPDTALSTASTDRTMSGHETMPVERSGSMGMSCNTCGADAAVVAIQLTATSTSSSTLSSPIPIQAAATSSTNPSSHSSTSSGLFAVVTANLPRSLLLASFALLLALFIASVSSSYNQTQAAAVVATAFDDFSSSKAGNDDARWTMYPITYKQFGLALKLNSTVNVSLYQPPFLAAGFDPYLINLCQGAPVWQCDYSKFASSTLFGQMLAASGGVYQLDPNNAAANYVRLELSWNTLTPALQGGSVTLNYHVVFPRHMLDGSVFPPTSLFEVKFLFTPKNLVVVAQGSSAFDGTLTLQLPSGSWNMYPFDKYTRLLTPACQFADPGARFGTWSIVNPASRNLAAFKAIALSFILKIDQADLGIFSHTETFKPSSESATTLEEGGPPELTATFERPPVNRLYPMFLVVAFWLILLCEIAIYFPYVGHTKKLDNFALVGLTVSLMFALPSIRNTMPTAPAFGAVIDFASFFWAVLVAILSFVYATMRYVYDTWPAPATPAAAK